jgi:transcriptional antiterminator RfaH
MHWYAISTKPHQEYVAEANLHRLGVETFCPQIKQDRIIRRKMQATIAPLFPGYLFAQFSLDQQYRSIVYARGVRRVVAFGSEPAIVDEGLIDTIKSRLTGDYIHLPQTQFKPGQHVRIQDGPLHGIEAIFERGLPGPQRAVILLKTLSYQARVVVDQRAIVNL